MNKGNEVISTPAKLTWPELCPLSKNSSSRVINFKLHCNLLDESAVFHSDNHHLSVDFGHAQLISMPTDINTANNTIASFTWERLSGQARLKISKSNLEIQSNCECNSPQYNFTVQIPRQDCEQSICPSGHVQQPSTDYITQQGFLNTTAQPQLVGINSNTLQLPNHFSGKSPWINQ